MAEGSGAGPRVVCLAGGVGGAKLAHGLQAHIGERLTVVVNTGDDLERHGLLVMPDHDTVMYTLAGLANRELGWGLEGETFEAAAMLERYGEETWFRLGDRDLATHVVRTARLRGGERLTDVCRALQASLGVAAAILPMTDHEVRTEVRTADGWLDFQDYFVRRHQEPEVLDVRFRGIDRASATREVADGDRVGAADRDRAVEPDRVGRADPRTPRGARRDRRREDARRAGRRRVAGSSAARR